MSAWRTIFFVTIVLYVVEIFVYMTLASGEEQPWNKIRTVSPSESKSTYAEEGETDEGTPLNLREGKPNYTSENDKE